MATGINGMAFYAVGALIGPAQATFGWSRASASSAIVWLMAGQMLAAPLVGPAMARFGSRVVAVGSMLAMAAGFAAMSLVATRFGYALAWFATALGGGGTGAVLWSRVVLAQPARRPGLNLGLALCGTGFAGTVVPLALVRATDAGWRGGPLLLAAVAVIGAAVVGFGLRRVDVPMDRPAGRAFEKRALGGRSFVVLLVGFALVAACIAGLIVHLVPMLVDRGVAPGRAAAIAGGIGLAALVGRAASGALVDRLHPPLVAASVLLLPAVAAVWLAAAPDAAGWGPAVLIGLAAGAEIDLLALLCAWCFGLADSARIHGWLVSGFCVGSASGPPLAGWVRDHSGSYQPALAGAAVLLALASGALLSLRRG